MRRSNTKWKNSWYERKRASPYERWRNRHTGEVSMSPKSGGTSPRRYEKTNENVYGGDKTRKRKTATLNYFSPP